MKASDFDSFLSILHAVSEIYGKKFSEGVQSIYFNAFSDFSLSDVKKAFNTFVKNPDNGQFVPKPADIIKILSGSSHDASAIAWTKVDKAVRMIGTHESVCFDDPIIHSVIRDIGGWISLGEKNEKEWVFLANDFKARYSAYKQKNKPCDAVGKLIGLSEANNGRKGFNAPVAILVGDQGAAFSILDEGNGKVFNIGAADRLKIELKETGEK